MTHLNDVKDIVAGRHKDPFSILGLHKENGKFIIRVFIPDVHQIDVMDDKTGYKIVGLKAIDGFDDVEGFFEAIVPRRATKFAYRLNVRQGDLTWMVDDPYRFGEVLPQRELDLISQGTHWHLWRSLGAHTVTHESVWGTHFAVWAPNARRVSVVGNFNLWDGRRHVMRSCGKSGVWEIFLPRISAGETYKFEMLDTKWQLLPQKSDPLGFGAEHPPATSSIVRDLVQPEWQDKPWMAKRGLLQQADQPISIYEVNLSSWRRAADDFGRRLTYTELATQLVSYAQDMEFTHIEIMPISEFPFNNSFGYHPVGLYAPTARHGQLDEFRALVEACHQANIGLILDWVVSDFSDDAHGLNKFDGTQLYQNTQQIEPLREAKNSHNFKYGQPQVENFLIANALYWAKEYHIDGLRFKISEPLDQSTHSNLTGKWLPQNRADIDTSQTATFLRKLSTTLDSEAKDLVTMVEHDAPSKGISKTTQNGGLGFNYRWNISWLEDSLQYLSEQPMHRKFHHHKMSLGVQNAFSEKFILPLGHDLVSKGNGSLFSKMSGSIAEKFANLRAFYGFMWGHPGKKLIFMGSEFAQRNEWNHNQSLDWNLLESDEHEGVQSYVRDLNKLYKSTPSLYQQDCMPEGFEWIEKDSAEESLFIWLRHGQKTELPIMIIANFSPNECVDREIIVPTSGKWVEKLNSDATIYGGKGGVNRLPIEAVKSQSSTDDNLAAYSIKLSIPPLTTIFMQWQS